MHINGYKKRVIDSVIKKYLETFGAVCVEGPKWCGKTWASRNQAASEFLVGNPAGNFQNRRLAELDISMAFKGEAPHLIDEWQEIPALWDATRSFVDENGTKGRYILTGSSTPKEKGIMHTGTGRIASIRMQTMSLFESEESEGCISLKDLCENRTIPVQPVHNPDLITIAEWIVRGGWPGALDIPVKEAIRIPREYIKQVIQKDIHSIDETKRDIHKVELLLRSLARNESTTTANATLCADIKGVESETVDPDTVSNYLNALARLFIIDNQKPFGASIRSSIRVKQAEKRHFCDPSLACALLKLTPERLIADLQFMGFVFESLVDRDLRVYASSFGAEVLHYQDYKDNEIDTVIEMEDGEWAAVEVKLGAHQEEEAARHLLRIRDAFVKDKAARVPKSLIVILGKSSAAYTRKDGVHVVPLSALRP